MKVYGNVVILLTVLDFELLGDSLMRSIKASLLFREKWETEVPVLVLVFILSWSAEPFLCLLQWGSNNFLLHDHIRNYVANNTHYTSIGT